MIGPEADVGVRRQMEDDVRACHRGIQCHRIQRVSPDERETATACRLLQKALLPGREVVESHHGVSVPEQPIDQCAADEPGSASHECMHEDCVRRDA